MDEDQYHALCDACDQFLLAPDSSLERVATPWLHVIRAHPIFLGSYIELFKSAAPSTFLRSLRNTASAIRCLAKAMVGDGQLWVSTVELPEKADVLLVSHLVNQSFAGQQGDFYYGGAAGGLAAQGLSTTIALINYTDETGTSLAGKWRQAKIPRVIFSPVLGLAAELSLRRRVKAEARGLRAGIYAQTSALGRRVIARAAQEAASGGAVSALRMSEQIKSLVARLQPKAIVITYEGHSWERVAFAAAREVSPQILCIGYQHAALFNMQHAVQRRLKAEYNPDIILTSGQVAKAQLEKSPALAGVAVSVLGSNRSFARQPAKSWQTDAAARRACIVLPEGIASECNLLFGFSLECALALPDIEFIWRLHPNMSYAALTKQNPRFRQLPSNIILSTRTLAEDIARSHWGLYRGSTAIVQAVVSGVRPVYLQQAGEISIDTLYEIEAMHASVTELEDFKTLVAETKTIQASTSEAVQDYCEQMFTPMDIDVLAACITGRHVHDDIQQRTEKESRAL